MKIVRRGRAARRRRLGARRRPARRRAPASATSCDAARSGRRTSGTGSSRRCSPSSTVRRSVRCKVVVDAANGMAGTMLPPVLDRLPAARRRPVLLRARRVVPEPRAEPAPPGEPRLHRREDARRRAPTSASRTTAMPTAASSSTTRERSCPATSSRRCWRAGDAGDAEPGAKVIYDVRASWAVPRAIEEAGGVPLVNRVGHAFIKHRMREEDALFAGEVSAHYYFRDFTQADTGVVPFLVMLELLSREGEPAVGAARAVPRAVLHHRRDQHPGRGRGAEAPGDRGALRAPRAGGSPTSTASPSTSTTGTSTSARRTPSRSCGSTSRPSTRRRWSERRDEVLDLIRS